MDLQWIGSICAGPIGSILSLAAIFLLIRILRAFESANKINTPAEASQQNKLEVTLVNPSKSPAASIGESMTPNAPLPTSSQQPPKIPVAAEEKSVESPLNVPAVNTTPGASLPASSQQSSNIPMAAENNNNNVQPPASSPSATVVSSAPLLASSQQNSDIALAAADNKNVQLPSGGPPVTMASSAPLPASSCNIPPTVENNISNVQPPPSDPSSNPGISLAPTSHTSASSEQSSNIPLADHNNIVPKPPPIASANPSTPNETKNSISLSALDSYTPLPVDTKTDKSAKLATTATIPTTSTAIENLSVPLAAMTDDLSTTTTVTTINTTTSTMTPYPPVLSANMHSQMKPPPAITMTSKSPMKSAISFPPALSTPPPAQVTATAPPELTMEKITTPLMGLLNTPQISTSTPPQVHDASFTTPTINTTPPQSVSATATPFDFSTTDSTIVTTPTPGIAFTTPMPSNQILSTPGTDLSAASTLSDMSGAASTLSKMSGLSLANPKSITPMPSLSTPDTGLSATSTVSAMSGATLTPNNMPETVSTLSAMCEAVSALNAESGALRDISRETSLPNAKITPEVRQRALDILKGLQQQAQQTLSLMGNMPGHESSKEGLREMQQRAQQTYNQLFTPSPPRKNPNVSSRRKVRVPKSRRKPKKAITPGIPAGPPVAQKPPDLQKIAPPSKSLTSTPPRLHRASKSSPAQKPDEARNPPPPANSTPSTPGAPLTDDQIKKRRLKIVYYISENHKRQFEKKYPGQLNQKKKAYLEKLATTIEHQIFADLCKRDFTAYKKLYSDSNQLQQCIKYFASRLQRPAEEVQTDRIRNAVVEKIIAKYGLDANAALRVEHIIFAQECKRDVQLYKQKIASELEQLVKTFRNAKRCHCTPGCQR